MQRAFHLIIAFVFAIFAVLNLNDPDPWIWVLSYGAVSVLFTLSAFGHADRRISGSLGVALAIWMLTMLTGVVQWARSGFPSIASTMQATEPHIEVVREFLGLLIAVFALLWLTVRTPRDTRLG